MQQSYLASNLSFLRKAKGIKQAEIQDRLGFVKNTWSNWENAKSQPNIENLLIISQFLDVDLNTLITENLSDGKAIPFSGTLKNGPKGKVIGKPLGKVNDPKTGFSSKNSYLPIGILRTVPAVVTVDSAGNENIVHVPVRARAGYLMGYGDQEYISSLQTYSLPGLRGKTFRSFEVEGLSMKPTLQPRDWVVGEWVEGFEDVRDNRVHIIVTKNDGILVKRVLNRISERGKLYLKSDTIQNRADYPTIELDPADVSEIWYARMRFGTDFSEPSELFKRIDDMEISIMELQKHILKN